MPALGTLERMPTRVMVTGCCGAGKSTLARRLATHLDLPLTHLDQEYWRPGWVRPERQQWQARVAELVTAPQWVHDGNYDSTLPLRLPHADLVVFVDLARWRCLWRIAKRRLLRNRADRLEGCAERVSRQLVRYVWRFPKQHRRRLLDAIAAHADRAEVVRLRTPAQVRGYLARLEA